MAAKNSSGKKSGEYKGFMGEIYAEPEIDGTPMQPGRTYPTRLIKRHSLKTRITHDVVAISCLWLIHFRFGPVEWIWRMLTYGQRLPLRSP